jgi:carbon storage regulator
MGRVCLFFRLFRALAWGLHIYFSLTGHSHLKLMEERIMLVLTRKPGEQLVIDNNIVITVVEVRGNRVRISIDAPEDVRILRGELACWVDLPSTESKNEAGPVPCKG